MHIKDLIARIEVLIEEGGRVAASGRKDSSYEVFYVDNALMSGFRAGSLSYISKVFGTAHSHFTEFDKCSNVARLANAKASVAILQAIKAEISSGWLTSIKSLITSELFSDFLDMATHFLDSGYKDPAAVMIGSVLEEHLRQLCLKNEIEIEELKYEKQVPKSADRLNNDLSRAEIYTKLDQKQITAWLDIRNNAAHGKYEKYSVEQVKAFLDGVLNFMIRIPS